MYKAIVAKRIRNIFNEINSGHCQPMIDGLSPEFKYIFHGDHSLSGSRTSLKSMELWWSRVFHLLPGAQFTIHQIVVQGHPWNTTVAVRQSISIADSTDGGYSNVVMQFMHLRWGKVTRIETLEDTKKLGLYLSKLDVKKFPDAMAPPIVDG